MKNDEKDNPLLFQTKENKNKKEKRKILENKSVLQKHKILKVKILQQNRKEKRRLNSNTYVHLLSPKMFFVCIPPGFFLSFFRVLNYFSTPTSYNC